MQLEETAEKALEAMFAEMRAAGYNDIFVSSGYRSYSKQSVLFNTYINKEMEADKSLTRAQAIEKVKKYSAVAGTSEHQSGLCVDLISSSMKDLDLTFAQNPAFKWLKENAYKFGFILRYPDDKVTTTGYNFEPWHFRFVGQYHAAAMRQSGLCLEEYVYALNHPN
jgi:D-alanyl-D-alanine carboxypeptidase